MSIFHNIISRKELKNRILSNCEERLTLSFYKYFTIDNPINYRDKIYKYFYENKFLGRIYISVEGINAQISIPVKKYFLLKSFLYNLHSKLKNIRINQALNNKISFWVLSVKIKKKIVQDGILDKFFHPDDVGIYIDAKKVNEMLYDKEVTFVDMRNFYEYEIGHFENAVNVKSITFREQLQHVVELMKNFKNKKIVMYCTGGIRCEKATSWMKYNGFKHVYHILGGIIGYVHSAKKNKLPILFKGKNFVFDYRMSEKISDDVLANCTQCNISEDTYKNCANDRCHLLFIQCQNCAINYNNCCSVKCMNQL